MKNQYKYSEGFSLVELAVVMMIMGVMIGTLVPIYQGIVKQNKVQQDAMRQYLIISALENHFSQYKYIPCPAINTSHGTAQRKCMGPQEQIGLLPYASLGIPSEYAINSFGHPITYVVASSATLEEVDGMQEFDPVEVKNESGDVIVGGDPKNPVMYLLINHGENGEGAFRMTDDRDRIPAYHPAAQKNSEDNLEFITDVHHKDFKQQVFFSTKPNMIKKQAVTGQ